MALTRPKFYQVDTTITAFNDPITVLNSGATQANVDVGFLFNRANGLVSNVALYWSEANQTFTTAYTTGAGANNSNISATSYANIKTGNITAAAFFWANGAVFSSSSYGNTDVAAYLPTNATITGIQANLGAYQGWANTRITAIDANLGTATTNITTLFSNAAGQANQITGANAAIVTANSAVVSFVGTINNNLSTAITANTNAANAAIVTANTSLKSYVDTQDSAITTAWTANAATQATSIRTLDANLGTATTNITTLFSNAGTQQTQINSLASGANANVAAYLPGYTGSLGSITTLTTSGTTTVGGNLNVSGNLNVTGNVVTFSSNDLVVSDSIIYIADNNSGDVLDIGIVGHFINPGYQHTGLVRDASDGVWKLFANVVAEPSTTVDFTNAIYSPLRIGALTASSGTISGTTVLGSGSSNVVIAATTTATSSTTGALVVTGGVGITGNLVVDGNVTLGNLLIDDTEFLLFDNADPTKKAQFNLSGLTTNNSVVYSLPPGSSNVSTLVDLVSTQTLNGAKTFSSTAINMGSSTANSTQQFAYGATVSGSTKTINIGTSGAQGSFTNMTIGPILGYGNVTFQGNAPVLITNSAASTDTTTGALEVFGGVGIGGNLNVGGTSNYFSGSVGIGQATPAYKLDINGTGVLARFQAASGNYGAITISDNTSTSGVALISNGNDYAMQLGGTERLRLTSAGVLTGPTTLTVPTINTTSGNATTFVATNFSSGNISFTNATSGTVSTANVSLYESVTATTTNATHYPMLSGIATGNTASFTASGLTYNPSTSTLSTSIVSASGNIYSSGTYGIRVNGAGGTWFWLDNPTASTFRLSSGVGPGDNPIIYTSAGNLVIGATTTSVSTTTGALVVKGGVGVAGTLSATTLTGTLSTAAQTNITSVGTLTGLTVNAQFSGNTAYADSDPGNYDAGQVIAFANQNNITGVSFSPTDRRILTMGIGPVRRPFLRTGSGVPFELQTGNVIIASTTTSTSTSTGALVVKGGAGVAGQVTAGNIVTTSGVYWANGAAYSSGSGGGITYTASATAPVSPSAGNFWYDTSTDIKYQYINDGTSSYWVDQSYPTSFGNLTVANTLTVGGSIVGTTTNSNYALAANVSLYESVTATTTNATFYPMLSGITSGNTASFTASTLTHNPSTGNLTSSGYVGTLWGPAAITSGNITGATTINTSGTITGTGVTKLGSGSSNVVVAATTTSSSTTTGALVVTGGVGLTGQLSAQQIVINSGNTAVNTGEFYSVNSATTSQLGIHATNGANNRQSKIKFYGTFYNTPADTGERYVTSIRSGFDSSSNAWGSEFLGIYVNSTTNDGNTDANQTLIADFSNYGGLKTYSNLVATNGSLYSRNLLLQGDGTNAYIRPRNAGSSLYLGAADGNYLQVTTTQSIFTGNVNPTGNLAYNLGTPTAWWNNMYGKAIQAQYADLAEHYTADAEYDPGTVVVFGGTEEITVSDISHDPRVAGVISTDPAYLMNAANPGLPVALTGRVPCQVQGPVAKGDRLVNIRSGVAGRLDPVLHQYGCIIGKSLGEIPDDSVQTIEIVVGRF
jgi:hypothetical protein